TELRVALLDYGPVGDHGWTYEGHMGAERMARKLPYVKLTEQQGAAGPDAPEILEDYARRGFDLIFCHSLAFGDAIRRVAPLYPDVIFMWGAGDERPAPNVGTYYARIYEAEYLAGIVAGSMTRSDRIAFVAAIPHPEVVAGVDAFARGVALVNPSARVYVEWIGEWYNPDKEGQAAGLLINQGCDVITHWSDSDATGEVAEATGTYFISFHSDMSRSAPHVYLTGALWDWEPVMTDIVESVHNGTWRSRPGQEWCYGLSEGGVKLAPLSEQVPEDVASLVEETAGAISRGELEVFPGMSDEDLRRIYYLEPNVVGSLPEPAG
ncbi:MAG: BMP family ABC transporter substrate-binding protein, partial [Methanothrix sp.]|nr:BMP family ABC transporter substrate-binding protein [Methanothrix sp.]